MLISWMQKGVARGVADAGGGHHVQRAADAAAVDGGDHRYPQFVQAAEGGLHAGQQVADGGAALGAGVIQGDGPAKGLQCHAGAEMLAGAADHQGARLAAAVQLLQQLIELAPEGRVHGVEALGPVQHQMRHLVGQTQLQAAQLGVQISAEVGIQGSHAVSIDG